MPEISRGLSAASTAIPPEYGSGDSLPWEGSQADVAITPYPFQGAEHFALDPGRISSDQHRLSVVPTLTICWVRAVPTPILNRPWGCTVPAHTPLEFLTASALESDPG